MCVCVCVCVCVCGWIEPILSLNKDDIDRPLNKEIKLNSEKHTYIT